MAIPTKNRLKYFYDASFEAIFLSRKGICLDQNKAASSMFGYSKEEAIGKPGTDWIAPEDRETVKKNISDGYTSPYEVRALRKDGTTFPAQIQGSLINDGEDRLRVTALRDISQLKQALDSLEKEKEKYKILMENANDAIYIAQDGLIKFANPKTFELYGYPETILQKIPIIQLMHPEDRDRIFANYEKRIRGENFPSTHVFRALNKKNKTIWVQSNAVRIIWEGKNAVLVCIRDISRIKELEEKLKKAEKMELIGIVAGGVAHDLNNILSGLVSYPELLLLQLEKDNPLRESISFMHGSGLQAADIVQDLLALSRRGVYQTSIVNLNKVVHAYFRSSAHLRLEREFPGISFQTSLEDELLNLKGSESHISKIIMNLVMNAVESMDKKGRVTVETFNLSLDQSIQVDQPISGHDEIKEGEYVILRVSDNGEGIKKPDINKIFEPFYTKKQMGRSGSGLGLSVVWNTVRDHQGYIQVFSEKHEGTRFDIYFPGTRDMPKKNLDDFQLESFHGNNETILVIDDNKRQRKITQECLTILGYIPFAVDSGEKALLFLKTQPVDLIILDMKMNPGMDGLETYKKVLKINPAQKTVIVSGLPETQQVKEALDMGVGQYIKKPYTIEKFAVALKKELNSEV